jgi:hypothetical protein
MKKILLPIFGVSICPVFAVCVTNPLTGKSARGRIPEAKQKAARL